jgi:hypothetical protein
MTMHDEPRIKVHAHYTCPLWEYPDGRRAPGMTYNPNKPPIVGWVNVMELQIAGEHHRLLLTTDAL